MSTIGMNNNLSNQQAVSGNTVSFGNANLQNRSKPIVVNPPKSIYKYNMYEELNLGSDKRKEYLNAVFSKSTLQSTTKSKVRTVLSKIAKCIIIVGGIALAFKHRAYLKNLVTNCVGKLINIFKK